MKMSKVVAFLEILAGAIGLSYFFSHGVIKIIAENSKPDSGMGGLLVFFLIFAMIPCFCL